MVGETVVVLKDNQFFVEESFAIELPQFHQGDDSHEQHRHHPDDHKGYEGGLIINEVAKR